MSRHLHRFALALIALASIAQDTPRPARTEMIAMRDGVRLATDIYLPEGAGPWPTVVLRTPYHRQQQAARNAPYTRNGYAYVVQDWRGLFDSEGQFTARTLSGYVNAKDGYDTIEWIARQSWSNGKVGITGGSAPGIAAKQAALANPPHLVAAFTTVATMFPGDYAFYHGGVPRTESDRWSAARGLKIAEWPRPRGLQFQPDAARWPPQHREAQAAARIALLDNGGWFDIFGPSLFDDFNAIGGRNNRVIMAAKGHGAITEGLQFPSQQQPGDSPLAWFDHWLKGKDTGVMRTPPVRYFLMGDTRRTGAPGNAWRQADRWPVPSTAAAFYAAGDGTLRRTPPADDAALHYIYDPREPVPTIGGANLGPNRGPLDQRKLDVRNDVLRLTTEPLEQPLAITGKVTAALYISADVPDTTVMAKLIDVYPDGYQALILDNALMARYRDGFAHPAPMEKGRVYKLTLDLWSTALVFDRGHRIALHIAGGNAPRYEVHPNSFTPVNSYQDAPVAHVTVHAAAGHASRLILPVVPLAQ